MLHAQIELPLYVQIGGKDKNWHLNLNVYRNSFYHQLSKAKLEYAKLISPTCTTAILPVIPEGHHIAKMSVDYVIYPSTKRKFDLGNVASIVEKFFLDTLQKLELLKNDDYECVFRSTYNIGSVAPNAGYVLAGLTIYLTEPKP
jgi:hypothetical protein